MVSASDIIAKRYKLDRKIGAGAYADTWLAHDQLLDRKVAVKILRPQFQSGEEDRAEFRREAHTAASISHPNVVATFDAGVTDDVAYLVMEFVDGINLKQEIRARGRLDPDRALAVADDLLSGLGRIHAAGIIHRDVKPQNVLVAPTGTSKLTDFGIARNRDDAARTRRHTTAGSAAYMAPEQALGEPVTPAADIYAVGVVMYEMLTGRLPFFGEDPHRVIEQHVSRAVTPPRRFNPRIPAPVERVVLTAMAKRPEDRYQSADEMRSDLRAAEFEDLTRKTAVPAVASQSSGGSRVFWIAAAAIMMLTLLAGSTAIAVRDFSTRSALPGNYFGAVEGNESDESQSEEPHEQATDLVLSYDLDTEPENDEPVDRPAPGGTSGGSSEAAEQPDPTEPPEQDLEADDSETSQPATGGTGGMQTDPAPVTPEPQPTEPVAEEPAETSDEGNETPDSPASSEEDTEDEAADSSEDDGQSDEGEHEAPENGAPDDGDRTDEGAAPESDEPENPESTEPDPESEEDDEGSAETQQAPEHDEADQDTETEDPNQDGEQPDGENQEAEQSEESGQQQEADDSGANPDEAQEDGADPDQESVGGASVDPDDWSWGDGEDPPSIEEATSEFWEAVEKYQGSEDFDWKDELDEWVDSGDLDDDDISAAPSGDSRDDEDDDDRDRARSNDDDNDENDKDDRDRSDDRDVDEDNDRDRTRDDNYDDEDNDRDGSDENDEDRDRDRSPDEDNEGDDRDRDRSDDNDDRERSNDNDDEDDERSRDDDKGDDGDDDRDRNFAQDDDDDDDGWRSWFDNDDSDDGPEHDTGADRQNENRSHEQVKSERSKLGTLADFIPKDLFGSP